MKKKILIRRMLRSPQFVIGFLIVLAVVIVSLFAKQLAPMDENLNHIAARFTAPQGSALTERAVMCWVRTSLEGISFPGF